MFIAGGFYEVHEVTDFRDLLNKSVELYGDEPAYAIRGKNGEYSNISYYKFRDDVNALGAALLSLGFGGGRVAVMGNNSYKWCVSYLAVTCGGKVVVPIDKELNPQDIENILNVSEAKIILFDNRAGKKIDEIREKLSSDITYISFDLEDNTENILSYEKLVEKGRRLLEDNETEYLNAEINSEEMAALLFTSGTTGMSKAVMLSQKAICFDVMSTLSVVRNHLGKRTLSVLPLHHTFECTLGFLTMVYQGVCIAYCENIRNITRDIIEYKPHTILTVPLLVERIYSRILKKVAQKPRGELAFNFGLALSRATNPLKVKLNKKIFKEVHETLGGEFCSFIVGAASIKPEVVKNMRTMGVDFYLGYGLTECAPLVIGTNDKIFAPDSVGVPLPGVEAKIINADENGVGEICVRGPMLMLGYYNMPEETDKVIKDGWFHTGDLGTVDKDGLFRITGRIKNVIVTKTGKNIYPEEIEYYLNGSPMISESMVMGSHGDAEDTEVMAKVYPNIEEIAEFLKTARPSIEDIEKAVKDVIQEINEKLPVYKKIKKFDILKSDFQKTTTQKIKRHEHIENDEEEQQ